MTLCSGVQQYVIVQICGNMFYYPDLLSYWHEEETIRDASGYYVQEGVGSYSDMGQCRLEYSVPQSSIDGNDKKVQSTTAAIYAPLTLSELPKRGQKVKVVKIDNTEHELTVINSERGLLHVRIWVE